MTPIEARFSMDEAGWCREARHLPSPNCDPRPTGACIDLLVIHNISLPPGEFGGGHIDALFTNQLDISTHSYFAQLQGLRVSAHFLIARDGSVTQYVSTLDRAWHAGVSTFGDRQRCNDFSIGIELEGDDHTPFCNAQYTALIALTDALCHAHPLCTVTGHQHIAPGRKTDPGPHFDWARYQSEWSARQSFGFSDAKTARLLSFFA